jgi:UDP-N-acetylmuramoyl-L-alanyl-D-glutamate--2,6-diaminopimelate ligase
VLIAGKGHESTQDIGGVLHAFDDTLVARDALGVAA